MKKKVLSMLLASSMLLSMAACGSESAPAEAPKADDAAATETVKEDAPGVTEDAAVVGELVDGKFPETKEITVEIYDRGNDGGTDPENNMYTEYIKKGMLEEHNVAVTFKKVPRWTETEDINNLLAAGEAPDICVTYSYPTVLTYAAMGGVVDLAPYIEQYISVIPNLYDWLGETNIFWDEDPKTGNIWAIEGRRAEIARINTFVRKDWLDKLGLKEPTTTQEFEDMLIAFRDNAETLLGKDAGKMIPYSVGYDVGWRASNLIDSYMDPNYTEKEEYILGFDDRKLTQPNTKEAVRLLNKWYNEDLMWKDFALYGSGDTTEDDLMKAGYVGAFTHNWDYPFRNGDDGIAANLKRNVSEDAQFVAVECFENKAGKYVKWMNSSAGDRKLFFPSTNDEPLASLLYLDFISKPETIAYLQMGDEGVTHEILESGAVSLIAATGDPIQNSGKNIDYTITCNGINYGDEALALKSIAYGYGDCADPAVVQRAYEIALHDGISPKNVNVGVVESEAGVGDTLSAKRDQVFDNAVVAAPADFDSVWDTQMADYLSNGGQAIIDERTAKWAEYFGDADMLP